MIVRGRWLLRPERPPIENAAVVIDNGRVVEVGPWLQISPHVADRRVIDPGDAILIPGLVNAHTHLGLSDLKGKLPPPERFTDWLKALVKHVRGRDPPAVASAVRSGLAESATSGVTTLAEVGFESAAAGPLAGSPVWVTLFAEIIGHGRPTGKRFVDVIRRGEFLAARGRVRVGLSPHAPYSTGLRTYVAAAEEAGRRNWPLTTHLHETPDEIELYLTGKGEFSRWLLLRAMLLAARFKPPGKRPIQALDEAGFFSRPILVAHGNYLDEADIDVLRRSGSTVVYCPRSHDYFGHTDHPYRRLMVAGVPVALGTDSLASSPSLSILDEMRFVHRRDRETPPEKLLEMATSSGADALGRKGRAGQLAEGEDADLAAVRPAGRPGTDPYESLLATESRVIGAWVCGRQVAGEAGE